jgi:hypothetical protein
LPPFGENDESCSLKLKVSIETTDTGDFLLHHHPGKRRSDHGSGSGDNSNITLLTPGFFAFQALEGLEVVGEEHDMMKDIHKGTRDGD